MSRLLWTGCVVAIAASALSCGALRKRPGRGEVDLDPPGAGTLERPLPIGTVEERGAIGCDDAEPGATCRQVTVKCDGIPDKNADIAVTRAKGRKRGTVFTHLGTGGTEYFNRHDLLRGLVDGGYDVVQIRWASDWEATPKNGMLSAACRPATLMQHVYESVHDRSKDQGFCAVGFSGGSGALSYALAHYGKARILDFVVLAAGPPFARLDYGCAPHTYRGPERRLCASLPDAPIDLPPSLIDPWSNTWTCGDPNAHPDDLARWKADSVISKNADFHYPNTEVGFYDCTVNPNGTTGGAFLLSSEITSSKDVTCFTDCGGEDLGDAGWDRVRADLLQKCAPRHGG